MTTSLLPTTRKLARIARLESSTPLTDQLNVSKVEEWTVVTSVDDTNVGVFFEPDALLPESEWFSSLKIKHRLVKVIKIRGVISQGLFAPRERFDGIHPPELFDQIGEDVTSQLGVTKVADVEDPSEALAKLALVKGETKLEWSSIFPKGPGKTDEPRVQNVKEMMEELRGKPYYITLKVDGTSATYTWNSSVSPPNLIVCSRNNILTQPSKDYHPVALKYHLEEKLKNHPNWVLQAENYGPKINKNLLKSKEVDFFVFNVHDTSTGSRLGYNEFLSACRELEVPHVPILEVGSSFNYTVDELIEMSKGVYDGTDHHREGIVVRSQEPLRFEGEMLSFKVINPDYLVNKYKQV